MTATEYGLYQKRVGEFLRRNEVKPGCFGPVEENQEPYFSWHACECCLQPLGGMREDVMFATNYGPKFEATICTDCIYFLTYDRLDDSTMAEIEASETNKGPFLDRDTFMRSW